MRIPPIWVKEVLKKKDQDGQEYSFNGFGWSFDDESQAKEMARLKAKKQYDFVINHMKFKEYEYLHEPLREEIIEEVLNDQDKIGIISRNRYGALVLNTNNVCFADIDFPFIQEGFFEQIISYFSKSHREKKDEMMQKDFLKKIRRWSNRNSRESFRLYRTHSGLRLLFTGRLFDPSAGATEDFLKSLECDPLYVRLTRKQECFRARLTPKPWRCDYQTPPNEFPRVQLDESNMFGRWLKGYEHASKGYSICKLIGSYGPKKLTDEAKNVVEIHDRYTCLNQAHMA